MPHTSLDFGYPWWLNYGHLAVFAVSFVILVVVRLLRGPLWMLVVMAVVAAWAGAAAIAVTAVGFNRIPSLPTENFFRAGVGRVVDLGAGTGRSSIMVLTARPNATLVASDLFGTSFDQHFGTDGTPQERLLANLKVAGVDTRASIATADMRKLPFESESFDAAVSAYAMDHLGSQGAEQALAEAHRVLKPGSEFLLILVGRDAWTTLAFGPLLAHSGLRGANWWRDKSIKAGFSSREEGRTPATLFFLLKRT
jgi:SAM-dependent methyltransferase